MSIPKMPMIVAICGAKRSGKDVLAQHLVDKYNYERVAFAQPLKLAIKSLFNFDDDQVGIGEDKGTGKKDIVDERWGITPRTALQFFGTEIMQEKIQEILPDIKKNFFANTLKNYIADKIKINPDQRFVISDLRFLHEYKALFSISKIRKDEIAIIRVIRPSLSSSSPVDYSSDLPKAHISEPKAHISEPKAHISELEYMNIPYDIILINNGSIESYIDKFDKIIRI
jgi:hypothetical protein